MKKLLLGLVIGSVLAVALAVPVVLFVKNDKYKHGRSVGYLDGQRETMEFLRKHFSVSRPSRKGERKDALSTKSGNIYVVESNGVLTIETY